MMKSFSEAMVIAAMNFDLRISDMLEPDLMGPGGEDLG